MAVEIITRDDLFAFKAELLKDLKTMMKTEIESKKRWLRSREVVSMFNISPGTLQNYRINKLIPFTKIGNTIYYPLDEIEQILNNNSI